MYSHGIAPKPCSPATAALEQALKIAATPVINKERPMISFKRSFTGSFDLSSLVEASQPVEDSIAFPSIEWSYDIDSEDDIESPAPPAKRRCRGLARTEHKSSDLVSLGSSRMESFSSLC
jgi:hypothetical protein